MTKRNILAFILIFCVYSVCNAQQLPTINHYFLNTYIVNPAYAGISGYTDVMFLYRKQWVGIPGAPETNLLSLDWPIKSDKAGLGLQFSNDRTNVISRTSGYGSFSYKVKISTFQRLYFGVSLGFINTNIDFDRIRAKDLTESTLLAYPDQSMLADGSAGIAYQFKSFRVGLSAMQLFQSSASFANKYDNKQLSYGLVRHYLLLLEYAYEINDKFRLYPMLLVKSAQGLYPQIETNATLYYIKSYWLNANYRIHNSLSFTFGFVIDKRFAVGYTYELPSFNKLGGISSGSHEFMLKFRFVSATGRAKTGYEFIDNSIKYFEEGNSEQDKIKDALPKKDKP